MADFVKQHIEIEPCYSTKVREFKTLVLNIDCTES